MVVEVVGREVGAKDMWVGWCVGLSDVTLGMGDGAGVLSFVVLVGAGTLVGALVGIFNNPSVAAIRLRPVINVDRFGMVAVVTLIGPYSIE
jgi:hypothetical protein